MRFLDYLRAAGYKKFEGVVSGRVYRFFACPHPERGCWFVQMETRSFQCVGCSLHCETDAAEDFQLFLPLEYPDSDSASG
jgi:hypothetical protein